VKAADTLAPQQTKSMIFTGTFAKSNAAPMVFKLNNETCEAYVSGKPGDPSRRVEQLSDGTTRFGPVPTAAVSVPIVLVNRVGESAPSVISPTSNSPVEVPESSKATTITGPASDVADVKPDASGSQLPSAGPSVEDSSPPAFDEQPSDGVTNP
jgi:serine/threonine-protein kinase